MFQKDQLKMKKKNSFYLVRLPAAEIRRRRHAWAATAAVVPYTAASSARARPADQNLVS